MRPHSPTATPPPAIELLARAYQQILHWPCPTCGQRYPCPCDLSETPMTGNLGGETVTGAHRADSREPNQGKA